MVLDSGCDDCVPPWLQRAAPSSTTLAFSALPFLATFLLVATLVFQRLYPFLSTPAEELKGSGGSGTSSTPHGTAFLLSPLLDRRGAHKPPRAASLSPAQRLANLVFSSTVALSVVLTELVLCELADALDPAARALGLRATLPLLLALLLGAIPGLEIHALLARAGYRFAGRDAGRYKPAWVLQALLFAAWLGAFWSSGRLVLPRTTDALPDGRAHATDPPRPQSLVDAATAHVGVIGIALMALLSGFASVSAPYHAFVARPRPTSEAAVARKQAGLDATADLLAAKRSRLRALDHKLEAASSAHAPAANGHAPGGGLLHAAARYLRPDPAAAERRSLRMEVAGLENMATALAAHRDLLAARHAQQRRAATPAGRLRLAAEAAFAVLCVGRVAAGAVSFLRRRLLAPDSAYGLSSGGGGGGVDALVGAVAAAEAADRALWARRASLALASATLLAGLSAAPQTVALLARLAPGAVRAARANLALGLAQLCAAYAISAALLVRGRTTFAAGDEGLRGVGGGAAELGWVDGWFEAWFLGGAAGTALGVWVAGAVRGAAAWEDDEEDDVEMGKMS